MNLNIDKIMPVKNFRGLNFGATFDYQIAMLSVADPVTADGVQYINPGPSMGVNAHLSIRKIFL